MAAGPARGLQLTLGRYAAITVVKPCEGPPPHSLTEHVRVPIRQGPPSATATGRTSLYAPRDVLSTLAAILGFRDRTYRRRAVDALRLTGGDTVVEIGCGTGRNFRLLQDLVGPTGRLIAIDVSSALLARAQRRVDRHGWLNVELVHSDATAYEFPEQIDGALATYSLVAIPDYDRVVQAAFGALKEGHRCAVLDQTLPSGLASRLVPIVNWLSGPIPYRALVGERQVWVSMERYFGKVAIQEFYFGFVYLATGEKPQEAPSRPLPNER